MALEVTVGELTIQGEAAYGLVEVTVRDPRKPRTTATFGYLVGVSVNDVILCSIGVEQVPIREALDLGTLRLRDDAIEHADVPEPKPAAGLTVSAVRDLPLARWEAAARAHVAERYRISAMGAGELARRLGFDGDFAENLTRALAPVEAVDRLRPGLRYSTQPGDVRKYRSLLHLAGIAKEFRQAQLEGAPDPAATIAKQRDVNPSTVRSWLHRARRGGLLSAKERRTSG